MCDGSSDRALQYPIEWLLKHHNFKGQLDWSFAVGQAKLLTEASALEARVLRAIALNQPDLVFVHRDAESDPLAERLAEIETKLQNIDSRRISVVPVTMLESWLLFDEMAIRRASGNPNATVRLDLPKLSRIESTKDPKRLLKEALKAASGLKGKRLQKFHPLKKRHLVAEEIADFSPLLQLPAFDHLSGAVEAWVSED